MARYRLKLEDPKGEVVESWILTTDQDDTSPDVDYGITPLDGDEIWSDVMEAVHFYENAVMARKNRIGP